jgi:hypothetical protein
VRRIRLKPKPGHPRTHQLHHCVGLYRAASMGLGMAFLAAGFAAAAVELRTITLSDPADISAAAAVNAANSAFNASVAECYRQTVQSSGTYAQNLHASQACDCGSTAARNRLKNAYRAALADHPHWNWGETVVGYANSPTEMISLNFRALTAELGRCG